MGRFRFSRLAAFVVLVAAAASATGCTDRPETSPLYHASAPLPDATGARHPGDIAPAAANLAGPHIVNSGPETYRVGSGDRLRISVYGEESLTGEYLVDGAGTISMPLISQVTVGGLTTGEAQRLVADRLRDGFLRSPNVAVQVLNYRPFFILGEVRTAGQFPYVDGMSVQTAVAIAGGYTPRARKSRFKVTRLTPAGRSTFMLKPNAPVAPGDTIYVDERFF